MLNGRNVGTRPRHKKGSTSLRHGLTGAFTLSRSLLPSGKRAYIAVKQQYEARKSVVCPTSASRRPPVERVDRRRRRPPSTPSASSSSASSVSGDDISKSSVLRIRDTFASSSYLRGVYCERDKGDLSVLAEGAWRNKLSRTMRFRSLRYPFTSPPAISFRPLIFFHPAAKLTRGTERDRAPEREQYFYKRREEKQEEKEEEKSERKDV